jgi:parallel beta-helix repeat protein
MRKSFYGLALSVVLVALVAGAFLGARHLTAARAASCIPNVDGHGHSAVVVNPGSFTGTLNATGCNIGIYVSAGHTVKISQATIFGASFGDVVVDGTATVQYSSLTQSEMGIEFGDAGAGHGSALFNTIAYVDNGCGIGVFNNGTTATLAGNTITGPSTTVADPIGIDAGAGPTSVTISHNSLSNNVVGIDIFPSSGVGYQVENNTVQNNATGIEVDSGTGNVVSSNLLKVGTTGVLDDGGTNDQITRNFICGFATPINTAGATNPTVSGNSITPQCKA